MWNRRAFLERAAAATAAVVAPLAPTGSQAVAQPSPRRVPVIDITDLYHPPQDPGDNLDLIAAFGLPEVDLRAVILDVTARFREPVAAPAGDVYQDAAGPRDAGFIPVWQLNALFGRSVPCAVAPYATLRSPDDSALDAPPFQQQGIDLLLETLRDSAEPVHIVSFGSARPLAVAYNRDPALLRRKIACAHVCAGSAPAGYLEWNVMLDVQAFRRVLESELPLALYPCASDKGPFELGKNNTYWKLPDLELLRDLAPGLRRYALFAFSRAARSDFLRALEHDLPEPVQDEICRRPHNVWETAVWAEVSGRALVRRGDGSHRLLPSAILEPSDTRLPGGLIGCRLTVRDDGQFDFTPTTEPGRVRIYERADPIGQERALREALPALYRAFQV